MWRDCCANVGPTYGCDENTIRSLWSFNHTDNRLGRVNLTRLYNNRSI